MVGLLLEEVDLVDVDLLQFQVVLFKVGDVLDDLLKDVVSGFSCMVLECGALRSEELHLLFVIVEHFACLFGSTLITQKLDHYKDTYIERVDSVLDRHHAGFVVAVLAEGVGDLVHL